MEPNDNNLSVVKIKMENFLLHAIENCSENDLVLIPFTLENIFSMKIDNGNKSV